MIENLSAALRLVLSRSGLLILLTLTLLAWVALLYWWLGLPVGGTSAFIALTLAGVLLLALAAAWFVLPFRRIEPRPSLSCLRRGAPWIALLIWAVAGVFLSSRLIVWVPDVDSLPLRFVSAGARFLVAAALFTGAWVYMASCCSICSRKE
jgi:hypothetical protein